MLIRILIALVLLILTLAGFYVSQIPKQPPPLEAPRIEQATLVATTQPDGEVVTVILLGAIPVDAVACHDPAAYQQPVIPYVSIDLDPDKLLNTDVTSPIRQVLMENDLWFGDQMTYSIVGPGANFDDILAEMGAWNQAMGDGPCPRFDPIPPPTELFGD